MRLTPKAGSAPLQTASKVRITNLNADLLDGKDSTEFVPKATFDALKAAYEAKVAGYDTLLAGMTRVTLDGEPTLRIAGVNVQIVNGIRQDRRLRRTGQPHHRLQRAARPSGGTLRLPLPRHR